MASSAKRNEFGLFLRSRRERLDPHKLGLPKARRRRTAGLRREEVAERAGISTDWYVRLEQGRTVNPSATTIDALARALKLDKAEHDHLRALAGARDRQPFKRESVPVAMAQLVRSLNQPAYITGRRWDVLVWNQAAAEILGFDRVHDADRNILVMMLTTDKARRLFGRAWTSEARRMIAEFRATHDLWADDPAFVALLQRLRQGCPEFEAWWKDHDIRRGTAGRKRLSHARKGELDLAYASFRSSDDPTLKLVIYTPQV